METPFTSTPPAADPVTSLAIKRAVMIDDLTHALLNKIADDSAPDPVPSSRPSRRRASRRTGPRAGTGRSNPPITCTVCHVTYMTTVALPPSVSPEYWVCGLCLGNLPVEAR